MTALIDNWASLYSHHPLLRTFVAFLHVGGLIVGGGFAIAVDRLTSLAAGHGPVRSAQLHLLHSTHSAVLAGIAALVLSGLLLLGADVDMYLYSKVFWIKMALFGLLLVNGVWLLRAEREIGRGNTTAWAQLRTSSAISLALWLATTLAGVALPNIG